MEKITPADLKAIFVTCPHGGQNRVSAQACFAHSRKNKKATTAISRLAQSYYEDCPRCGSWKDQVKDYLVGTVKTPKEDNND